MDLEFPFPPFNQNCWCQLVLVFKFSATENCLGPIYYMNICFSNDFLTTMFFNPNFGFDQMFQALNVLLDLAGPSSKQFESDRDSCNGANFQHSLESPIEHIENVRKSFPLLSNLLYSIMSANMLTMCYVICTLSGIWTCWMLWTVDRSCIRFYLLLVRK